LFIKGIFDEIRAYRTTFKYGFYPSGKITPNEDILSIINGLIKKTDQLYVWRTVEDEKVRESHAFLNNTIRHWSQSPNPGDDHNCRCWAENLESIEYKDAVLPVYPELFLIPALKVKNITRIIRSSVKFFSKNKTLTDHGLGRLHQRNVSQKDVNKAIKTAKQTNNIHYKKGKYGTAQKIYKGSNGLTVIQETEGRNAGKIITLWWHN
jgi:hypothetical protein